MNPTTETKAPATVEQKPSVGRIVHLNTEGEPLAAIVTAVDEKGRASLCVLNPNSMFFLAEVEFSKEPLSGSWSWPPRA